MSETKPTITKQQYINALRFIRDVAEEHIDINNEGGPNDWARVYNECIELLGDD